MIVTAQALHGNKWAIIARLLERRTDNSVKNHWNSTLKRKWDKGSKSSELRQSNMCGTEHETRRRCFAGGFLGVAGPDGQWACGAACGVSWLERGSCLWLPRSDQDVLFCMSNRTKPSTVGAGDVWQ
jgi:Myb-like DNA-binding domain